MPSDLIFEAPPAYDLLEPSAAATQILFGRLRSTVQSEHGGTDERSLETNRLHNFLLYCLAVDYRCRSPVYLSASDREHFLKLCQVVWDIERLARPGLFTADHHTKFAPYLWKYLHEPCVRLGLPVEAATVLVIRYGKHQNAMGLYKGSVHGVLHNRGLEFLARKLITDNRILIPRVALSHHMQTKLTQNLLEVAGRYFATIKGICCQIDTGGPGVSEFDEPSQIEYTLTEEGKSYETTRNRVLDSAYPSSNILDGVLGRLLGLWRRYRGAFLQDSIDDPTEVERGSKDIVPTPTALPETTHHIRSAWDIIPNWRDSESVFLPDLFEQRLGQGRCDS